MHNCVKILKFYVQSANKYVKLRVPFLKDSVSRVDEKKKESKIVSYLEHSNKKPKDR